MLNNPDYKFLQEEKYLKNNICLLTVSGSKAYGLADAQSDTDIRGIALESKEVLLGLEKFEVFSSSSTDTTIYALSKFVSLAMKGNVNVLEILFTNPSDILICNEYSQELINNRELFLTNAIYKPLKGILYSYIKQMKNNKVGTRKHDKALYRIARLTALSKDLFQDGQFHININDLSRYGAVLSMIETIMKCSNNPYDDLQNMADSYIDEMFSYSKLPEKPDYDKIQNLVIDMHEKYLVL